MHSNFADRPQSGPYLFRYNFKSAAKRPFMYRISMIMAAIRPHRFSNGRLARFHCASAHPSRSLSSVLAILKRLTWMDRVKGVGKVGLGSLFTTLQFLDFALNHTLKESLEVVNKALTLTPRCEWTF
jgi:hypothetical protein